MSVLVTSILVGCGVLIGRIIAKGARETAPDAPASPPVHETSEKEPVVVGGLERFPCALGDVLLRRSGDEAWLAGAILLREGNEVAMALFVSPDAGGDRLVLIRPNPSDDVLWLAPVSLPEAFGEPPSVLEIAGERFERKRRLPFRAERVGSGAPDISGDVILAEYTGLSDERAVVIAAGKTVRAYRGSALPQGTYEILPGTSQTI